MVLITDHLTIYDHVLNLVETSLYDTKHVATKACLNSQHYNQQGGDTFRHFLTQGIWGVL